MFQKFKTYILFLKISFFGSNKLIKLKKAAYHKFLRCADGEFMKKY